MDEEKILGGVEKIEKKPEVEKEIKAKEGLEKFEKNKALEKRETEKIEKSQTEIEANSSGISREEEDLQNKSNSIADLEKIEDQIQKLTEIASQEGPQKALKIARTLNSNYALDKMHDRLIDEKELREILIKKGYIEKVE